MPIYEFACRDCGHRFETLVFNDAEAVLCPHCESKHLTKLISAHSVGATQPDTPCSEAVCGQGACPACE